MKQRLCFQFNEKDNLLAATAGSKSGQSQQEKRGRGGLGNSRSISCNG
jgi:hypothetical protein